MPVKLNAKYVSRICNERLKRTDPTRGFVSAAIGLPRDRRLIEATDLRPDSFQNAFLQSVHTALSASRSLLATNGNAGHLLAVQGIPLYEKFCILLYLSSLQALLEAMSEKFSVGDFINPKTVDERGVEPIDLKELVRALFKVADTIDDTEIAYLLGFSPRDGGLTLYNAYGEWMSMLCRVHRIDLKSHFEVRRNLVQEAVQRFDTWLSAPSEASTWLRNYLAIKAQERAASEIQDNLASVHAVLQDWREAQTEAVKKRKVAWEEYRSDLRNLPDSKDTMFGEKFGVRRVFIQPLASYRVAGSDAVAPQQVTDVGNLMGALLSTRVPGDELILLCGGPGSGKSTLCRILASELAADAEMHPVFLRLRRLREGREVLSFLEQSLQQQGIIDRVADLRNIPNLVLILDGFDELVMASRSRLREFFNSLREDLDSGPLRKAKAIVSGRDTLFPGGVGLPYGSHVISLSPFDRARVAEWGTKWRLLHQDTTGASFQPEVFISDGDRMRGPLHHLVSWPLTLHLVARVHTAGQLELAEQSQADVEKAYLYRAILAQTAQRQLDKASGQDKFDEKGMRDFLRSLAWEMYQRSRESLDLSDVEPVLARSFKDKTETEIAELADVAVVNSPELTKGEETGFEFVHKSFGEYLAAEKIAETLEKISFKVQEFDSSEVNWRMSVPDAASELAAAIGIRLLPAEVQEMLEPMLGDYRAFFSGRDVNETGTREAFEKGLTAKAERLEDLVRKFCGGMALADVARGTKTSTLVRNELEAYANYGAGLLVLGSAISRRFGLMSQKSQKDRKPNFPIRLNDLWSAVHIIEAGGVFIDEPLAQRLFGGVVAVNEEKRPIRVGYPPLQPSKLRHVSGLHIAIEEDLEKLVMAQVLQRQMLLTLLSLAVNPGASAESPYHRPFRNHLVELESLERSGRWPGEALVESGLLKADQFEMSFRWWHRGIRELFWMMETREDFGGADQVREWLQRFLIDMTHRGGFVSRPRVPDFVRAPRTVSERGGGKRKVAS